MQSGIPISSEPLSNEFLRLAADRWRRDNCGFNNIRHVFSVPEMNRYQKIFGSDISESLLTMWS